MPGTPFAVRDRLLARRITENTVALGRAEYDSQTSRAFGMQIIKFQKPFFCFIFRTHLTRRILKTFLNFSHHSRPRPGRRSITGQNNFFSPKLAGGRRPVTRCTGHRALRRMHALVTLKSNQTAQYEVILSSFGDADLVKEKIYCKCSLVALSAAVLTAWSTHENYNRKRVSAAASVSTCLYI